MTNRFNENFSAYASGNLAMRWSSVAGSPTFVSGPRAGINAVRFSNNVHNLTKTFSVSHGTWIVGWRMKLSSIGTAKNDFVKLREGATIHTTLTLNTTGQFLAERAGTATVAGPTAELATTSWDYYWLKVIVHDSTGRVILVKNGTTILDVSSLDTRNGGSGVVDTIEFQSTNGSDMDITDIVIMDGAGSANNDIPGGLAVAGYRVDLSTMTSDGTYTDGTPTGGGAHYTQIDDADPSSADNVQFGSVGNKDSYGHSATATLGSQVFAAVELLAAVEKDDAGAASGAPFIRSGSTDSSGTGAALPIGQIYQSRILETDPATSAAWTLSGWNNAQPGYERTA